MKVDYLTVQVRRATCEACSGNLDVSGTIPAFALVAREVLAPRDDSASQLIRMKVALLYLLSPSVKF